MVFCVDGLQQPPDASAVICDADAATNGTCSFDVPLRARKQIVHRRLLVRVGRTRRVSFSRVHPLFPHPLRLRCLAADAAEVITCEDGLLAGQVDGEVCDFDRACDGNCSFALPCPLCSYDVLNPCLQACFFCPASVDARVPVGGSQFMYFAPLHEVLVMKCVASSVVGCATTPTSTTLYPPECLTDTDCLRYPKPCHTCIEGECIKPADAGHASIGCVTPLVTTTTLRPSACGNDMDCRLPGGPVAGCRSVGMCSYCTDPYVAPNEVP